MEHSHKPVEAVLQLDPIGTTSSPQAVLQLYHSVALLPNQLDYSAALL
jgi:hypothetical protein